MLIFVVDDDVAFNKLIVAYLTKFLPASTIKSFYKGEDCISGLVEKPDIIIQDYDMPGINGIETMKNVKKVYPDTEVIFLSGQSDFQVVIDAIKLGAYDYIVKDNYAKDNALNKITKIIRYNKLKGEKMTYRFYVFLTLLIIVLSWIIMFIVGFI